MKKFLRHQKRLSRGPKFVALAALLGLSALGLTQCRMVGDTVTGVELNGNSGGNTIDNRNKCFAKCDKIYKDTRAFEELRHRLALRQCDRCRTKKQQDDCKKAENRLHDVILKKIEVLKQLCKNKCYNEGGGHGGR